MPVDTLSDKRIHVTPNLQNLWAQAVAASLPQNAQAEIGTAPVNSGFQVIVTEPQEGEQDNLYNPALHTIPSPKDAAYVPEIIRASNLGISLTSASLYSRLPLAAKAESVVSVVYALPRSEMTFIFGLGGGFSSGALVSFTQVAPKPGTRYVDQARVEKLLGSQGRVVLSKIVKLIRNSQSELDWPLERIDVGYVHDLELKDWEYVLVSLVFNCPFELADKHLHEFYVLLDRLNGTLTGHEQEIIQRLLYFDVAITA